jgi:hypothetical protein
MASSGSPERHAGTNEVSDRTAQVAARLKQIYKKYVYPVEKKYQYDFFFESPFLSDVEFDGTLQKLERC